MRVLRDLEVRAQAAFLVLRAADGTRIYSIECNSDATTTTTTTTTTTAAAATTTATTTATTATTAATTTTTTSTTMHHALRLPGKRRRDM